MEWSTAEWDRGEASALTSELAAHSELMGRESFLTGRDSENVKNIQKNGIFHRENGTMNQENMFSALSYKWKNTVFGPLMLLKVGRRATLGSV